VNSEFLHVSRCLSTALRAAAVPLWITQNFRRGTSMAVTRIVTGRDSANANEFDSLISLLCGIKNSYL